MAVYSPLNKSVDLQQYQSIVELIRERNSNLLTCMDLGVDIENSALLNWLSSAQPSQSVPDFIDKQYPKLIESYFLKLRNACFTYCLKKTNDFEKSEDISQDAILQLLKARQPIKDARLWLRQVSCNILAKQYKHNQDHKKMLQTLEYEVRIISELLAGNDIDLSSQIFQKVENTLYESSEYRELIEIQKYPTLTQYAHAKGISYDKARQFSKEIKKNFKAKCLKYYGWEDSPEILSFNQLKSIQRYLNQLIKCPQLDKKPSIRKNSSLMKQSDIRQTLVGFDQIDDWGIHIIGSNKYRIHIFCNPGKIEPLCVSVIITIKENNRIVTESCKVNRLAAILTIPPNVTIPKNKGKSALTFEQIKTILSE